MSASVPMPVAVMSANMPVPPQYLKTLRNPHLLAGADAFPCGNCTKRQGTKSYADGRVLRGTVCELDLICWTRVEEAAEEENRPAPEVAEQPEEIYSGPPFEEGCIACGKASEFVLDGYTCCGEHTLMILEHLKGTPFPWETVA